MIYHRLSSASVVGTAVVVGATVVITSAGAVVDVRVVAGGRGVVVVALLPPQAESASIVSPISVLVRGEVKYCYDVRA